MNILYLGYENNSIIDFLKNKNSVTICTEKFDVDYIKKFDFVISYGYRHIIKKNVIDASKNGIINLHISYLPWNRGADPNFWSFFDKTKKGVTIHFIDEGVDTGDIILQKEVKFYSEKTLGETYNKLRNEIEDLFIKNWKNILSGNYERKKQPSEGSFHLAKEFKKYNLVNGWETQVDNLKNMKKKLTDLEIVDEVEKVRTKNNVNWMDILRLAIKYAPKDAKALIKKINQSDGEISNLLGQLSDD